MTPAQLWIVAAAISLAAHASFAAWVETREVPARPKPHVIEMQMQAPRPRPLPEPAPVKLPDPPPPPKKPVVHKIAPKPVPAPVTPEVQKVGIDENKSSSNGLAVAAGGNLEGDVGTGNTMDKTPPAPEPPPAPPAPSPAPQGKHFVPEFKVTRLPQPRSAIHPELPAAFREAQREAHVTLEVEIDENGHVVHARLVGKDEFGLAAAVVAAVEKTEFEPALVGTQPVPVRYHIPFTFRVHG